MPQINTDGQVALIVNKVFRSMSQLDSLADRYSPTIAAKREDELRTRIEALITETECAGHVSAKQIAGSLREDYSAGRAKYLAAGARRFFEYPLNWIILEGEVKMETAVEVAKKQAKAKAKARRQQPRPVAQPRRSPAQSLPE